MSTRNLTEYPEVLNDREVAEFFGINRFTVQVMARRGKIHGQKVGNRWFFHKSAIENLLTLRNA